MLCMQCNVKCVVVRLPDVLQWFSDAVAAPGPVACRSSSQSSAPAVSLSATAHHTVGPGARRPHTRAHSSRYSTGQNHSWVMLHMQRYILKPSTVQQHINTLSGFSDSPDYSFMLWCELYYHLWAWSTKPVLSRWGYICSNSQQYILWVKIIHFSFMPKIIRILSKDYVQWRYLVNFQP